MANANILLGGDFNLGNIDWSIPEVITGKPNQEQHHLLLDIMFDNNLQQIVNIPTRSDKTLDLIFTNNPGNINKVNTIPPIGLSDHDIVYVENDIWLRRVRETPKKIYKYKTANWDKIKLDLENTLQLMKNLDPSANVNDMWNIFKSKLTESVENNIPHKLLSYKNRLPWIHNNLRKMINRKNKLYYKMKKDKKYSEKYKNLKKQVQKEQRTAYWSYIENMILDLPVNEPGNKINDQSKPKNLFSYIKAVRTDNSGVAPLKKEGHLIADTKQKANILNSQFQSVFTTEPDNINIPDKGPSPHPDIKPLNITLPGVQKLLQNINPYKASGPDNISGRVLKELHVQTAPILTMIFEKSLKTGITPTDWKHANVAPAFKKGEKYKPVNYRPISLTCISCKLMEHIITKHIITHLETNNILYDLQHGFRQYRSCETQLISFVQELASNNNTNRQTDLIIMDFAKAFDKVPHRRLLYKLQYYGIKHETLNWVTAFLSDRTQTVVLDGESSDLAPVTSGVPQGTVLGPVLFLAYINDLPEYLTSSKLRLFADDSIIYRTITSANDCEALQNDLNAAARWESDWLMAFHPDKCNVLTVTQKKHPFKHDYILHNHTLELVTSAKYLGITLQSNLKWSQHTNNIVANGNKQLGFLKRNLKTANENIKSQAYLSLVRPKLEYSCSVWDPHTSEQINKIEMVQRRAARYASNRYHNTSSVNDMLTTLNWQTLQERRQKFRLTMLYKIVHNLVAIPTSILVPTDHRIRKNHNFTYRQISVLKDSYKISFFPYTIIQWNALPSNVVNATTVETFRDQLTPAVLYTLQ